MLGFTMASCCTVDVIPCAGRAAHHPPSSAPSSAPPHAGYTFGAPRTGNHAHVRTYNASVPDTWHIINNDDIITKTGKVGRAGT